jgi:tRNA1Val (adenine37-N6)-methyltransferase
MPPPTPPPLHPDAPAEPDELGALTDDAIAGDFRIAQRRHGHRYSLDDVLTAWEAARAMPAARRCLELGSGVGSVLLMLAYKLPDAEFVAIEAQRNSFRLLERNVAQNGLGDRVRLIHGDLRAFEHEPAVSAGSGGFDLITGTPPYVPPGMATPSPDAQRAYARQEYRGGVEAYVAAGARGLAAHGRLVVCGDARFPERVIDSAAVAGLVLVRRRDAVPRAGSGALFSVFTLAWPGQAAFVHEPAWLARDESGARTAAYHEVRAFFGMAAPEAEPPSP